MKSAVIPVIMIREEPEQIKRCVRCWFVRFSDEAYINCSRTPPHPRKSFSEMHGHRTGSQTYTNNSLNENKAS